MIYVWRRRSHVAWITICALNTWAHENHRQTFSDEGEGFKSISITSAQLRARQIYKEVRWWIWPDTGRRNIDDSTSCDTIHVPAVLLGVQSILLTLWTGEASRASIGIHRIHDLKKKTKKNKKKKQAVAYQAQEVWVDFGQEMISTGWYTGPENQEPERERGMCDWHFNEPPWICCFKVKKVRATGMRF